MIIKSAFFAINAVEMTALGRGTGRKGGNRGEKGALATHHTMFLFGLHG